MKEKGNFKTLKKHLKNTVNCIQHIKITILQVQRFYSTFILMFYNYLNKIYWKKKINRLVTLSFSMHFYSIPCLYCLGLVLLTVYISV